MSEQSDDVLFERFLGHGPAVRIRRTSEPGVVPVTAVLEVDRRAGTPRAGIGVPPPLIVCEAPSENEALALLRDRALDDRVIAQLMREKGLR
jgi:hypothetical protein